MNKNCIFINTKQRIFTLEQLKFNRSETRKKTNSKKTKERRIHVKRNKTGTKSKIKKNSRRKMKDHVAACPRSGLMRAMDGPLERAVARYTYPELRRSGRCRHVGTRITACIPRCVRTVSIPYLKLYPFLHLNADPTFRQYPQLVYKSY